MVVQGGRVSSPQIRDLKDVVERKKAAMGLFISLNEMGLHIGYKCKCQQNLGC
jgi:hypothetical protein